MCFSSTRHHLKDETSDVPVVSAAVAAVFHVVAAHTQRCGRSLSSGFLLSDGQTTADALATAVETASLRRRSQMAK